VGAGKDNRYSGPAQSRGYPGGFAAAGYGCFKLPFLGEMEGRLYVLSGVYMPNDGIFAPQIRAQGTQA
jgi:hypothetical protein